MAKWIEFREQPVDPRSKRKTRYWTVWSKSSNEWIGRVYWYAQWRKYCFFPTVATVFEQDCLRDIADFCERETKDHYAKAKQPAAT